MQFLPLFFNKAIPVQANKTQFVFLLNFFFFLNWLSRAAELRAEVTSERVPSLSTQQPKFQCCCCFSNLSVAGKGRYFPIQSTLKRSCGAEEAKLCLSPDFNGSLRFLERHKAPSCC